MPSSLPDHGTTILPGVDTVASAPQVDAVITEILESPSAAADVLFEDERVVNAFKRLREAGPAEFLRSLRPGPEGDLIGSALLRLLAGRHDAVDGSVYRTHITDFLDSQYGKRLRAYYKQPRKRNAYEVLNAFAPLVETLEAESQRHVFTLSNLSRIEVCRQHLLRHLNSPAGRLVFHPFLPERLLMSDLPGIFREAISVRDASDRKEAETAFRRLTSQVEAIEQAVSQYPTKYAHTVGLAAANAVRDGCRRTLELTSPPARLSFSASDRPLPLLEPGVTCGLRLSITNDGDAPADRIELVVDAPSGAIAVADGPPVLERVAPNTREDVWCSLVVTDPASHVDLDLVATWSNPDHSIGRSVHHVRIEAHQVDVDWAQLEVEEPYAPYPVDKAAELIGRERDLTRLLNNYSGNRLANLYVTGQRRVGKTSLMRVFAAELDQDPKIIVATVEMGEAREEAGLSTVGTLGRKLAMRAISKAGLKGEVGCPRFGTSLAPLTDVVEALLEWDEELSFVFVIDEFDELPHETFRRDGPGDALFVSMRSLAQKPNVGWLLVGGEKMPFIRDEQAARLNTFRELSLDYLGLADTGSTKGVW
jgi:hypothetical protein